MKPYILKTRIQARNLYLKGFTIFEIANKLDAGKSTVFRWCADLSRRNNPEAVKIARELYLSGKTSEEVGEILNRNGATIQNWCKDISRGRGHLVGIKNPAWKGGVTPSNELIRRCDKYLEWKNEILKRDNYKCAICQKETHELQVDHIKPFSKIIDENKITSVEQALGCAELWNLENGRSLCKPHHLEIGWNYFKEKVLRKEHSLER